MTEYDEYAACTKNCWWLAAGVGLLLALILWFATGWGFFSSLFAGIVVAVICGALFGRFLCTAPSPDVGRKSVGTTSAKPTSATADATAASSDAAPAPAASAAAAPVAAAAPTALATQPEKAAPAPKQSAAPKAETKAKPAKAKASKPKAEPKAVSTPAKAKAAPAATTKRPAVAADGKPELLTEARAGGADDLKLISGVGPKLQGMLNAMGVWHFDQVASWRKKEVQWVNDNLEGFKGRIERDDWVKQAKILAKGGETEFSARKKK